MTEEEAKHIFGNYIKDAAFPQTVETEEKIFHTKGLTKREYFAVMALQGILANDGPCYKYELAHARRSVIYADFLIEALNESQP